MHRQAYLTYYTKFLFLLPIPLLHFLVFNHTHIYSSNVELVWKWPVNRIHNIKLILFMCTGIPNLLQYIPLPSSSSSPLFIGQSIIHTYNSNVMLIWKWPVNRTHNKEVSSCLYAQALLTYYNTFPFLLPLPLLHFLTSQSYTYIQFQCGASLKMTSQ